MNKAKITRRRFLILTGAALGTCALSCTGLGGLLSQEDRPATSLPVGFPELTLGEGKMTNKILVAYATAAGSTGGVAEMIGKTLAETGLGVDVRPVRPVAEGRYVGAMFPKNYPGLQGLGMRFFIAYCGLGFRGGDFRDSTAIRAWAENLPSLLTLR
jgi:hypothetical protein